MKALILNNLLEEVEQIGILLKHNFRKLDIVAIVDEFEEAKKILKSTNVDILILSVKENEAQIAGELHKQASKSNCYVIIISHNYVYSLLHPILKIADYVLTPIQDDVFVRAVHRVIRHILHPIVSNHVETTNEIKFLPIPNHENIDLVPLSSIVRLESSNNYTTIYTEDAKGILTSKHIKDYENRLPTSMFFRVHNSHIINLKFIKSYIRSKTGSLILLDGSIIPISASRKKELVLKILV
jgi:two-component system, LytTR family, response regulator